MLTPSQLSTIVEIAYKLPPRRATIDQSNQEYMRSSTCMVCLVIIDRIRPLNDLSSFGMKLIAMS